MALKHVIVHVDGAERTQERIALAARLCQVKGARLTGLFAEGFSVGSSIVGRRAPDAIHAAMRSAEAAFLAGAEASQMQAIWWALEPARDVGALASEVAICCRYADLAVFGQPQEGGRLPEDVLESAILDSGRPVLVVPERGHHAAVGHRVVIAWTGSRESARAVNDALSVISGAEQVTVLAFQQRGDGGESSFPKLDIVAHLETHGIAARYERVIVAEGDDIGVTDITLNRSADLSADLVVMGARPGHGFGTARLASHARGMLRSMTAPVLLSA